MGHMFWKVEMGVGGVGAGVGGELARHFFI